MSDDVWMRRALSLALRGPAADPNPRVGCVLVRDGREIAVGWHKGAGTPHAEAMALAVAGEQAEGCTAYVTLEPCSHTGRTGPCAEALLRAGVSRVVYAADDPSPLAGGGADMLRERGVAVDGGLLADESQDLNRYFLFAAAHGRPFVTWKYAATLDGFSAALDGSSQWITGPEARADVHRGRASAGAIVVGTGTVLADDPSLTVRDAEGSLAGQSQPLRVVVGHRPIPEGMRVLDDAAPTLVLETHDPREVLQALQERQVRHVWLEGGPVLAGAFLRAGLVDEVVAHLGPMFFGAGKSASADIGVATITQALRVEVRQVVLLGGDVKIVASPVGDDR